MSRDVPETPLSNRILEKPLTIWERDNKSLLGTRREHVGFRKIIRVRLPRRQEPGGQGEPSWPV